MEWAIQRMGVLSSTIQFDLMNTVAESKLAQHHVPAPSESPGELFRYSVQEECVFHVYSPETTI